MSTFPGILAMCSADRRLIQRASTLAPYWMRILTTSTWLKCVAICSAVEPSLALSTSRKDNVLSIFPFSLKLDYSIAEYVGELIKRT